MNVKEGDTIWSRNKRGLGDSFTISKLPKFLRGSVLFKFPYDEIPLGTEFSVTAPPLSEIYIVHQKNSGWNDSFLCDHPSLLHKDGKGAVFDRRWISIKDEVLLQNRPMKLNILCRKTGDDKCTILPPISEFRSIAAIFLKEGRFISANYFL